VMLRHPVETIVSMHRDLVFLGTEPIADLGAALEAEPARRQSTPPGLSSSLLYREQVSYSTHLRRYLDLFGEDRVHVVMFDDLRADTAAAFRDVLLFLGVSADDAPLASASNAAKEVRSASLRRLILNRPRWVSRAARIFPDTWRLGVWRRLMLWNSRPATVGRAAPELLEALADEMRDSVQDLSELLRRDLSAWMRAPTTSK
jgi:hypothetical protein